MDFLRLVQEINPSFVDGPELTAAEQAERSALSTPATALLGQVNAMLRTHMFNDPTTGWVDCWQRSRLSARMEWLNGPEIPAVAAHLAAKEIEGYVSGVPGLRLSRCDAHAATLTWYGDADPVLLYVTRIVDAQELPPNLPLTAVG